MGTLVGTTSFGKGLVQELKMLDDGSGLKVTISRYFTPSGVCIQGKGIKPDVEIELPSEYRDIPVSQVPRNKDSQLKTGIETLKDLMNKQ
jgi:carboxyl-terminal processing protease